jgi:hypothetical protein
MDFLGKALITKQSPVMKVGLDSYLVEEYVDVYQLDLSDAEIPKCKAGVALEGLNLP